MALPYTFITPAGCVVESATPMTLAELIEIDAYNAQVDLVDCDWEDPDADGYGWERKALRGVR